MKRVGNLIPEIASFDNLLLAHYKAKKGKETKPPIWSFSKNLHQNLKQMQSQILSGQVQVGNYHYFTIYDPKERVICAASYPERVLHHAIMNVCHPIFEKFQIEDSYATRLQKGTFKAVERAQTFQKQFRFYWKFDIRKYFDSIDHHLLLTMLHKRFKDPILLNIFENIVHSYHVAPNKGIPIGNLTSQYFANHYLAYLDHFIKDQLQLKGYTRYMDDFIVWHNNKTQIQQIAAAIRNYIHTQLFLALKTDYQNTATHGLPFLGFRLFQQKILLSSRSKKRFQKKYCNLACQLEREQISQKQYQLQATALLAFIHKAYCKQFKKTISQSQAEQKI